MPRYNSEPSLSDKPARRHSLPPLHPAKDEGSPKKFPPLERKSIAPKLSEEEMETVGMKVMRLQRLWYAPVRCSKSSIL